MDCLVIADVFPSRLEPWRAPYNRRQIECLGALADVTVVHPLPWTRLPGRPALCGLTTGADDLLEDIPTYHPLMRHLPVLGRRWLWRSALHAVQRALNRHGAHYDVVLATFAYPHGRAARDVARRLGVPYVVKVRGTDLHSLPPDGCRRKRTAEALRDADAVVAVSPNLASAARDLGADPAAVHLLLNGVDADAFPVVPREEARRQLGLEGAAPLLLYVGHLAEVKGPDVLIESLDGAEGVRLALAGQGPMRGSLRRRVSRAGLNGSVRLLGQISHRQVALWMNAADALVLPSRREGCPNVVLEALCCGTPVVASRVGAVPELLAEDCGVIVPPDDPPALSQAIRRVLRASYDREAIRARAADMSWQANARRLHGILSAVSGEG